MATTITGLEREYVSNLVKKLTAANRAVDYAHDYGDDALISALDAARLELLLQITGRASVVTR